MHTVSSVAVVGAYVAVLTFVALRARAAREFSEFSLARRSLPLALVFGSLAATYVGPGYSIGFVGKGFRSGFLFLGIGLAYGLQNVLVGLLVAPRLRALNGCHTLGDAIGQKYDRKCQVLAGVISVSLCAAFASVMAKAGGDVVRDISGLPHWSSVLIVVAVTALYTTSGGLRASVVTDAFQFSAFATLLPAALLVVLGFHLEGGSAAFVEQASAATTEGLTATSPVELIGLLVAFLLGETLIPPYANRALASKTTRVSRNGFVLAGFFSIFWFMAMIALGVAARSILVDDPGEDFVLLNLVKSTMPPACYTLLLVVLISVVMSSLDSLLNAGAVSFTQDIAKSLVTLPDALNVGRAATIVIAAAAAVGAMAVPTIINGLLACYAVWAPAILPTLISGLWIKRPRPLAGILSMSVGLAAAITLWILLWLFFKYVRPSEIGIPPLVIVPALGAAFLAYAIGHWIEQSKEKASEPEF
ncbi:MAG: sodium:solute symporter family protein [Sedimentisphaerales bacterium]